MTEQPISSSEKTSSPEIHETQDERTYATLNARMLAAMLDSIISLLPFFLLSLVVKVSTPILPDSLMMKLSTGATLTIEEYEILQQQIWFTLGNAASQIIIISVIVTALWVKFGATPAKMILGMKLIDEKTGKNPGIWQSLWRVFGMVISTLPLMLGFFWINFNKKRQGWHDKMAGTVVIYTEDSIYQRVATKYARLLSGRKQ